MRYVPYRTVLVEIGGRGGGGSAMNHGVWIRIFSSTVFRIRNIFVRIPIRILLISFAANKKTSFLLHFCFAHLLLTGTVMTFTLIKDKKLNKSKTTIEIKFILNILRCGLKDLDPWSPKSYVSGSGRCIDMFLKTLIWFCSKKIYWNSISQQWNLNRF